MYYNENLEQLRAYCRNCLESLEIWARRLINEKMSQKYGNGFIHFQHKDGSYLVKKEIRNHVQQMRKKESSRFTRDIDTLFLDQIIYFLCNHNWYKPIFSDALKFSYPLGHDEVREHLEKLIPIRNALSHSNPISIRQAEQAICYSHDFIDGIKEYYRLQGKEQMWNVPRIIRITDSFGNEFENPTDSHFNESIFRIPQTARSGDTYSLYIEVDPSFARDSYEIRWRTLSPTMRTNPNSEHLSIILSDQDVGSSFHVQCDIVSNKPWHKHNSYDCRIIVAMAVLPPIE